MRTQAALSSPSRHAPRTGWWRRVLGPFHFTGVFWCRLPLLAMRVLPEFLVAPIVHLFAALFYCTLGGVRRALASNWELVSGPVDRREERRRAWRTILSFAWCLAERYEQYVPRKRFQHSIENRAVWDHQIRTGQGFVLVTAHLGNWEMGSTLPLARSEQEVHLVREPETDVDAQRFVEERVERLGGPRYRTHFTRGDLELGLELLHALREGHIVALQGDRPRAGGRSLSVPLFGELVEFPLGVPTLGRLARAPLIPVFVIRTGRRSYRVVFKDAIEVPRGGDRDADHRAAIAQFAKQLEWAIAEAPEQWFCFGELRNGD